MFALGVVISVGFAALIHLGQQAAASTSDTLSPETTDVLVRSGGTPYEQWATLVQTRAGPPSADVNRLEAQIMREGPFWATMLVRVENYRWSILWVVLMAFWQILACFCTGAALLKSGFFHGKLRALRRAFIAVGLLIGLPLNILHAVAAQHHGSLGWEVLGTFGVQAGGPLMSLMYLSLVLTWAESGIARSLVQVLANLGRMGLTGYLLESLFMSAIMLHWGLGWFGDTTWAQRACLVVGIYLLILIIANIWMWIFRIGPLEWLWRTATYLRLQPMLR